MAVRKQTSADAIIFSILNLIDKSNRYEDIYFKIGDELREFNNVSIQSEQRIRRTSESNPDGRTGTEQQQRRRHRQQNNGRGLVSKKPRFR